MKLFSVEKNSRLMYSHTTHPYMIFLNNKIGRIFFSSRNIKNQSSIFWIDIDLSDNFKVINISEKPSLTYSNDGSFDTDGVFVTHIIKNKKKLKMYYLGWKKKTPYPMFESFIGMAESSNQGLTFDKISNSQIKGIQKNENNTNLLCSIIYDKGIFKMWYGDLVKWIKLKNRLQSIYNIKYATSPDGINWKNENKVCIDNSKKILNVGHPFVTVKDGIYFMLYSVDYGKGYRIRLAYSYDGISWKAKSRNFLSVGKQHWNNSSVSHPFYFEFNNRYFLLYSGNNFGKDGIGIKCIQRLSN